MALKHFAGNPEFPDTPIIISGGNSTNDTDVFYILDPGTNTIVLGDVLNEDGTTSALANKTITTRQYGRFVKIVNTSAEDLECFRMVPPNASGV